MPNVRFGSKADIGAPPSDVRFTHESRHKSWPRLRLAHQLRQLRPQTWPFYLLRAGSCGIHRAAASALSSGSVLKAIAAPGAPLWTALTTDTSPYHNTGIASGSQVTLYRPPSGFIRADE